jgi:hypothetical protein
MVAAWSQPPNLNEPKIEDESYRAKGRSNLAGARDLRIPRRNILAGLRADASPRIR